MPIVLTPGGIQTVAVALHNFFQCHSVGLIEAGVVFPSFLSLKLKKILVELLIEKIGRHPTIRPQLKVAPIIVRSRMASSMHSSLVQLGNPSS